MYLFSCFGQSVNIQYVGHLYVLSRNKNCRFYYDCIERVQTKSTDGLSCLKQHFDDESQVILNLLNENNRHLSSLMFLLIHYECLLNTDVIKQKGCLHNFYYLYRRMI